MHDADDLTEGGVGIVLTVDDAAPGYLLVEHREPGPLEPLSTAGISISTEHADAATTGTGGRVPSDQTAAEVSPFSDAGLRPTQRSARQSPNAPRHFFFGRRLGFAAEQIEEAERSSQVRLPAHELRQHAVL